MSRDMAQGIASVMEGFLKGVAQGKEINREQMNKDREFGLKKEELELKRLGAKEKKPEMSYDDYLALDPSMPKDTASYERYVRAIKGKSDFHSTLMALAPGIANLPADQQGTALEDLYQKAMILKGKEYLTPEQRADRDEAKKREGEVKLEKLELELDQAQEDLKHAIATNPDKADKIKKEVARIESQIALDKAKTFEAYQKGKKTGAEAKDESGQRQIVGYGSEVINDKRLKVSLSDGFVNATAIARDIEDILKRADQFKIVQQPGVMGKVKGVIRTGTPTRWDKDKMEMANTAQRIIMSLRVAVTGGGNVSDDEQELLRLIVSNPSAFWNNVEASKAALRSLAGGQILKEAERGMAAGIVLPEGFFTSRGVRTNSKDPEVKKNWERIRKRYATQILSDKEFMNKYPDTTLAKNMGEGMVMEAIQKRESAPKPREQQSGGSFDSETEARIQFVINKSRLPRAKVIEELRKAGKLK